MYFILFIVSLGVNRIIILRIVLELLSWLFLIIIDKHGTLKYLLVQSFFFRTLIILVFVKESYLWLPFFLKIGLPPFHFWILRLASYLRTKSLTFFLTLHKIAPLLILTKIISLYARLALFGGLLVVGAALLFFLSNTTLLLARSSIVHSIWALFSRRLFISVFYWSAYSILVYLIFINIWMFVEQQIFFQNILRKILWVVLIGLPPFIIFWLKLFIIFCIAIQKITLFLAFMILIAAASLFGYLRFFHLRVGVSSICPANKTVVASSGLVCFAAAVIT